MGRNNSCVGLHVTHLDYLVKLLNSPERIFHFFKLISENNKKLIKDLLNKKIISYSALCFDLLKLFYTSQHKMIPCSLDRDVLNSFIYSYLLSVMDNSYRNLNLTQCTCIYTDCAMQIFSLKFPNRLNTFYIGEFNASFDNIIRTVDLHSDITGFAQEVLSEKMKCNLINIDKDYQSFLIPLEQDYTKSSKGYCSQVITINDKETNLYIMHKIKESKDKFYMENFNIVVKLNNKHVQNISKSISCTESINSHIINNDQYDSESDDASIIFAEQYDEKIHLENFVEYDSDSDGSIVFSENCNTKRFCKVSTKITDHNEDFRKDSLCLFANSFTSNNGSNDFRFQEKQDEEFDVSNSSFIEFINVSSSDDSENDDDWDTESEASFSLERNSFEPFDISDFQNQQKFSFEHMIGGGFINPCFEDDDSDLVPSESSHIKSINDKWNDSMKNVASEPRESRRVSFVPSSDLVSVHSYEVDEDDDYRYSIHVLNQLRFQNRISDFELIIAPYLTSEHRAKVYNSSYCCRR